MRSAGAAQPAHATIGALPDRPISPILQRHHAGVGIEQHGWGDPGQASGRALAMWGRPGGEAPDGALDLGEAESARRFDMGGRPFLTHVPMALAATEQLLAWGPARVAATLAPLTAAVVAGAQARGFGVPCDPSEHFVGLHAGGDCAGLVARLWARHRVHVSARGSYIRVPLPPEPVWGPRKTHYGNSLVKPHHYHTSPNQRYTI